MTAILAFLYLIALGVMLYTVYLMASAHERKHRRKTDNQVQMIMDDIQDGMTQTDIDRYLNWMFQCGVIDAIEYNKMRMDCIPFAKRNR